MSGSQPELGQGAERSDRQSAADALSALGSNREKGLGGAEAKARLDREGPNDVPEKASHPFARFARKFWGLSAWMIERLALLSFILGKRADLWIALALLFVNAILNFLQEQRASRAVTGGATSCRSQRGSCATVMADTVRAQSRSR